MSKTIKCLIIDDEPLAIKIISEYVNQIPQLELVATCTDAMQAFQLINQHPIELLFLDIEMPELNGINFIKSLSRAPAVILTTAYREYAIESYEINVVDYLLKPISFDRFFKAINKYMQHTQKPQVDSNTVAKVASPGSIYVYANKKNIKLFFDDILYIESIKDYVRIHTESKRIVSKQTISGFEQLLPDSFIRIHRSYIVNTARITAFTHQDIEIEATEIPIGVSYKKAVLERLKK